MRNIRAVLFDMDGLLLDTEKMNIDCVCQTAREMGFELNGEDVARRVMGVARARAAGQDFIANQNKADLGKVLSRCHCVVPDRRC